MKFLPYIFIFLFINSIQLVKAQDRNTFEIPRSNVIEIQDPDSGRVYPLFIKLPRSYNSQEDKSYPVIYLTDAWYSFQIVSGATRFPMNTGKMKEAIIVGISYSKGSKGPSSRIRDYTHTEDSSWKFQTGKAKEHISFIEKSVFPFIEKNYRVNESRTFVGNSLGGLFGAYILFTKPDMFNNYVLGSPSVWFKDNDILKIKTDPNLNKHKVFIAVGANETIQLDSPKHDMVKGAKELELKLSGELFPNTKVKLLTIQGANHETAFPTTAIQGLYWLFKE
ncbi:alpha/beta hydrolase [Psychrobium sp. 1_MG-2023]|uniref:alpha/beta hydrolase n=1 Tax=Psychrobium sp. 1_MG-2023 TaxID=3062624 RepID=UPI002692B034|nr:alpha/beta hydrolase-fold protein [Psychrobium sp. 1_MG-2023]MDP2562343.1 alpha/beta hydrolase-fold protein [Psychrobium sp. 1_MG-2023]